MYNVPYFANGMGFTEDNPDRIYIVKHLNGGTTVNAKGTYGPAIIQMLAPYQNLRKPSMTLQKTLSTPTSSADSGVCEKN